MNKQSHIHKCEKIILGGRKIIKKDGKKYIIKTGGTEVYKCVVPGCKYFIMSDLTVGNKQICWVCDQELTMTKDTLRLKHPTHIFCRRRKEIA